MIRIAVVSDIHGNLPAFEAVLADLRETSPDLICHGGDLPYGGANPAEILDRIRELGWPGVLGNTDEMLYAPETLRRFAQGSAAMAPLFTVIEEMAAWTREALGESRLAWLRGLPIVQLYEAMALVHASPESVWRAPAAGAGDAELQSAYAPLGQRIAIYAHIHTPFVRNFSGVTVANSGSASLSYDGDRRAAYLLLDDFTPWIRRVDYDVDREIRAVGACGLPHAEWIVRMLQSARPQMPRTA